MKKQIKFIYALLVIVIVGGGVVLGLQYKIDEPRLELIKINQEQETETIKGVSAVFFGLNDIEIEKIKKIYSEEDFYSMADDAMFYIDEASHFLKDKNIKIISTNKKYFNFIKDNGDIIYIDKNTYETNPFGGVILFDGKQDPLKIDILNIKKDYQDYFRNENNDYLEEVSDLIMKTESLDFLKIDLPIAEVVKKIGNPESKSEAKEWASDGLIHQTWFYKNIGIELDIILNNLDKNNLGSIYSINIKTPNKYKTARGIGIGSTRDEVLHEYKNKLVKSNSFSKDSQIIAGSIYGGFLFEIKNDVVSSIYMGAMAE